MASQSHAAPEKRPTVLVKAPPEWTREYPASIDIHKWIQKTKQPEFPIIQIVQEAHPIHEECYTYLSIMGRVLEDQDLLPCFKEIHVRFRPYDKWMNPDGDDEHLLEFVLPQKIEDQWLDGGSYDFVELENELLAMKEEEEVSQSAEGSHGSKVAQDIVQQSEESSHLTKFMWDLIEMTEDKAGKIWIVCILYED